MICNTVASLDPPAHYDTILFVIYNLETSNYLKLSNINDSPILVSSCKIIKFANEHWIDTL